MYVGRGYGGMIAVGVYAWRGGGGGGVHGVCVWLGGGGGWRGEWAGWVCVCVVEGARCVCGWGVGGGLRVVWRAERVGCVCVGGGGEGLEGCECVCGGVWPSD